MHVVPNASLTCGWQCFSVYPVPWYTPALFTTCREGNTLGVYTLGVKTPT